MDDFDDFSDLIKNVKISREVKPFKLNYLKLEHFYLNDGDIDDNTPISTSVELISKYNYELDKLEWEKKISYSFLSKNNINDLKIITKIYNIEEPEKLINSIEKYDLRKLNNNYFTEEEPVMNSHWELTYNKYFKIVGTYDQQVLEFDNICDILDFNSAMRYVSTNAYEEIGE